MSELTGPHSEALDASAAPDVERLEIVEFLAAPELPPRRPGPGFLEACAWVVGLLGIRLVAGMVIAVALILFYLLSGSATDPSQALNRLIDPEAMMALAGAEQFFFVLLVTAIVAYRYRGRVSRTINLSPMRPLHTLIVAGLVLPLSTLCTQLYAAVLSGWDAALEWLPQEWSMLAEAFDSMNAVEQIPAMVAASPLPLMVIIIAVAPAIGEELLFRGMLGRGLLARWGLWRGVLLTSVLFGLMHLHPVHAVAVIPLGIALHLIYVATRSFWAPVLLHFLNNAWATVAAKYSAGTPEAELLETTISPALLLSSGIAVIVLAALLYKTRTRYLTADGSEWSPGFVTVEVPSPEDAVRVDLGRTTSRSLVTAGTAWASFGLAFAAEVVALARQ